MKFINLILQNSSLLLVKLQEIIESHWYIRPRFWLSIILLPCSWLFNTFCHVKRFLYNKAFISKNKLPVPLVVIGNINVGGTGKTPLTLELARQLELKGIKAGIILRGYKAKSEIPKIVNINDESRVVGDEALIYATNGFPVAIGINRYLAGKVLLTHYPSLKIILSDDGLQHYKLHRDYEIAVIDSSRLFGNRYLLPMGPLREPIDRLSKVNAIVFNSSIPKKIDFSLPKLVLSRHLSLDYIYNPVTKCKILPADLKHYNRVIAIAAIGNPQRFFDFLLSLSIKLYKQLSFPDHYQYKLKDIPQNSEIILVTEKDYVKLRSLNDDKIWLVKIKVVLGNKELINQIASLL